MKFLCLLLLLSGCGLTPEDVVMNPVTRIEYGRTTGSEPSFTSEYVATLAGGKLNVGESVSTYVMTGPLGSWGSEDSHITSGMMVNPGMFIYLDENTFMHLQTEVSLYSGGDTGSFTMFAIEKEW